MPWAKSDNAQNRLETSLKELLIQQTAQASVRTQIARYLPPGVKKFGWIIEGESEPPEPYGLLKKASQARFGQGVLVARTDRATGLRYREQWWRLGIELHSDSDVSVERKNNTPPLGAILNQVLDDLFMTPAGRATLEALGIYNIRLTDEGDKDDGNFFSFDCSTDKFIEDAA